MVCYRAWGDCFPLVCQSLRHLSLCGKKSDWVTFSRWDFCFSLTCHWTTLAFVQAMQCGWGESYLEEGMVLNTSDTFIKRMPRLFGLSDYLFIDFHQSTSSIFPSQICHLIFTPLTSAQFSGGRNALSYKSSLNVSVEEKKSSPSATVQHYVEAI